MKTLFATTVRVDVGDTTYKTTPEGELNAAIKIIESAMDDAVEAFTSKINSIPPGIVFKVIRED